MLRFRPDQSAVFVGEEQEGPYEGFVTLFLVGTPPMPVVQAALKDNPNVERLYVGAGFLSAFTEAWLDQLMTQTTKHWKQPVAIEAPTLAYANCLKGELYLESYIFTLVMEGRPVAEDLPQISRA